MMIKSLKFLYFCCFSATFFGLVACNQEGRGSFPKAYGMVDNIRVICNDELWKEAVGDTFRIIPKCLKPKHFWKVLRGVLGIIGARAKKYG